MDGEIIPGHSIEALPLLKNGGWLASRRTTDQLLTTPFYGTVVNKLWNGCFDTRLFTH